MRKYWKAIFCLILFWTPSGLWANQVEVAGVTVRRTGSSTFAFDVTLRHADSGWNHYADQWQVVTLDGTVLGTRVLHHPHVDEQPFTRSLSGVSIPSSVRQVTIRGHDKVHGWGSKIKTVVLPQAE